MKKFVTLSLAVALDTGQVGQTSAGSRDALVRGVIGAVVGGAIANEANKNRPRATTRTTTRRVTRPANSSARTANRETQTALNYLGFPSGLPDAVMGRKSRAAISSYRAYLNLPDTGNRSRQGLGFLANSDQLRRPGGS